MNRSHRMERVNEVLRTMLGQLIHIKLATDDLVTLVSVDTTRDLKQATIYVAASQHLDEHVERLNRLAPEFQRLIKPQLDFRAIPVLTFAADRSGEAITRVESILDQL